MCSIRGGARYATHVTTETKREDIVRLLMRSQPQEKGAHQEIHGGQKKPLHRLCNRGRRYCFGVCNLPLDDARTATLSRVFPVGPGRLHTKNSPVRCDHNNFPKLFVCADWNSRFQLVADCRVGLCSYIGPVRVETKTAANLRAGGIQCGELVDQHRSRVLGISFSEPFGWSTFIPHPSAFIGSDCILS